MGALELARSAISSASQKSCFIIMIAINKLRERSKSSARNGQKELVRQVELAWRADPLIVHIERGKD